MVETTELRQPILNEYLGREEITFLLLPRGRILLQQLTGLQLVKKFPAFYATRRFITAFTNARHLPYSEPARSSSHPYIPHPEDPFYYYLNIYAWVSPLAPFPEVFVPKFCTRLSPHSYMLHDSPSSFFSILLPAQ